MQSTMRLIGLLIVLAIGVAIGVRVAERGIQQVSGPPKQVAYIKKVDQGRAEWAVASLSRPAPSPARVNYVSRAGESLGSWVKGAARSAVNWIAAAFWP